MRFISLLLLFTGAFSQSNIPSWTFNPADFQFTANITSQVYVNFQIENDSRNMLAAFHNDELRGIAQPSIINNQAYYFLTVYSNTQNDSLQFRVYDASADTILVAEESYRFVSNDLVGSNANPFKLNAKLNYDHPPEVTQVPNQTIEIGNTFSSFLLNDYLIERDGQTVVWTASGSTHYTISITSNSQVTITTKSPSWIGEETIRFTATDQTPNQKSAFADVLFKIVNVDNPPQLSIVPNKTTGLLGTFSSLNLNNFITELDGDIVATRVQLNPPNGGEFSPAWTLNSNNFSSSMFLTLRIQTNGFDQMSATQKIGAFVNDELRGVATPSNLGNGYWVYFLTVYANTNFETIHFKVYQPNKDDIYPVKENYLFQSNTSLGSPSEPVVLQAGYITTDIQNNTLNFSINDSTWHGTTTATLIATDLETNKSLSDTSSFQLEIKNDHVPKILAIPNQRINFNTNFTNVNLTNFEDERDGETVSWSVSGQTELIATITNSVLTVSKPSANWVGSEHLILTLTDQTTNAFSTQDTVLFQVTELDDQPSISGLPSLSLARNDYHYSFNLSPYLTVTDADEQGFKFYIDLLEGADTKPTLSINPADFSSSLSITATIKAGGKDIIHTDAVLAAYNQNELRGFAQQKKLNDSVYVFFLTVYGDVNDTISFTFFDPISKNNLAAQNKLVFKPGEIWGTVSNPYIVSSDIFQFSVEDKTLHMKKNDAQWVGLQDVHVITYDKNTVLQLADTTSFQITVINNFKPEFIQLPEQKVYRGNTFPILKIDSISQLLDADAVSYSTISSEQLNATINNNELLVSPVNEQWVGTDSIHLVATDQTSEAFSNSIAITYTRVDTNTAPIIIGFSNLTFNEDSTVQISLADKVIDQENDVILWTITSVDSNLITTIENNTLFLTTTPNYHTQNAPLKIVASDAFGLKDSIQIDVTIEPVNDEPIWLTLPSISFKEDQNYSLPLSQFINDVDGDLTGVSVQTANTFVSLEVRADTLLFSANANYFQSAIPFTLTASDAEFSIDKQHSFSIISVNDPPVLAAFPTQNLNEDDTLTLNLTSFVSDEDHSTASLTWSVDNLSSNAIHTTITGSVLKLWADENYSSLNESFDVQVADPENGLDRKTVTVNINPVSDAPEWLEFEQLIMNEDERLSVFLPNYLHDIDGGSYTFSASSIDPNLQLSINNDSLIVTATANYFTFLSPFEVSVFDNGIEVVQIGTLEIIPVNDAPTFAPLAKLSFNEDDSIQVNLSSIGSDIEDDRNNLTWSVETSDANMIATIDGEMLNVKAVANYNSLSTSLRLTLFDTEGGSSSQLVEIEITPVNDDPVIKQLIPNTTLDQNITQYKFIKLNNYFFDADGELNNYTITSSNPDVTTAVRNDTLLLSTNSSFSTSSTINITAIDSEAKFVEQSFLVSFRANTVPVETSALQAVTLNEDFGVVSITKMSDHFSDANNDQLQYTFSETALVSFYYDVFTDSLFIQSVPDQFGEELITVQINDGHGGEINSTIQITIFAVDDAPIRIAQINDIVVQENTPIPPILLSAFFRDVDSQISFSLQNSNDAIISATLDTNVLILNAMNDSSGVAEIILTAESNGLSARDTFMINIIPYDDAPFLLAKMPDITADEDDLITAINLLDYFKDSDTPPAAFVFSTTVSNASLLSASVQNEFLQLNLKPNAFGSSNVVVRLNSNGKWVSDTIAVTVGPIDDPLMQTTKIPALAVHLDPNDTTLIISNYFKDVDNSITYSLLSNSNPTLVVPNQTNGLLYIQFNDTDFGIAELILQATSVSGTLKDTLHIEVIPDNYPPELNQAFADLTVNEDAFVPAIYLPNHFSDRDTDPSLWHYMLTNSDTNLLQLSIENDSLKFTLSPNKFGEAIISITLESEGLFLTDSFTLNVQSIDDPIVKVAALPFIFVDENPNDTSFYLQNYYADVDNSIAFTIIHNSNPSLLAYSLTNDTLGLKFGNTANGAAIIVIEASSANTLRDTLFVQVNPVDNAPHIIDTIPTIIVDEDQSIATIPLLRFFGDIDSDPANFIFELTVSNQNLANIYISQDSLKMILNQDQFGSTGIAIQLTADGKSISDSFTILVNPVNDLLAQLANLPNLVLNENPNDTVISLSNYFIDVDNAVTFSILSNTNGTLVNAELQADSLSLTFSNEFVGLSQIIIKAESDIVITDTFTIQLVDHKVPILSLSGVPQANELRLNLSVDERLYNQPTFSIDGVTYHFVKTDSSGQAFHYVYPITQTKTYQFTAYVLDKGGNTASKSYSTTMITTTSNNQWISLTPKISIFIPYLSIDPSNVVSIYEVDPNDLNLTDAENNPLNLLSSVYRISFSQPLNFPIRVTIKSDSLGYSRTERNKIGLYFYNPLTEKWQYSLETSLSDIPNTSKTSIMVNNNLETNNSGSIDASGTFAFFYNENLVKIPENFSLLQNYPNPFNPNTTIEYHLPKAGKVTLTIYNSIGQTVKTIISNFKAAGYHEVNWDGRNNNGVRVASGIYFYQLISPHFAKTKRMVLLK